MAPNVNGSCLVQETVKDRSGENLVSKDIAPIGKGFVTGKNDTTLEVTPADELKEKLCGHAVERKIAHLIKNKEFGLAESL